MDEPGGDVKERVAQLGPKEKAVYDFLKFLAEEEKGNPGVKVEINALKRATRVVDEFERGLHDLPIPVRESDDYVSVTWLVPKSPGSEDRVLTEMDLREMTDKTLLLALRVAGKAEIRKLWGQVVENNAYPMIVRDLEKVNDYPNKAYQETNPQMPTNPSK